MITQFLADPLMIKELWVKHKHNAGLQWGLMKAFPINMLGMTWSCEISKGDGNKAFVIWSPFIIKQPVPGEHKTAKVHS